MGTFQDIATSEKSVPYFPGWSEPDRESGYSYFEAPLDIGGVTEPGVVLKGTCSVMHPDKQVSFEIYARKLPARLRVPLMRVDWRPLSGGHSNKKRPRPAGLPARVSDIHHHSFALNFNEESGKLVRGNLPFADECGETLADFEALCAYVGRAFRINNMNIVPRPDWRYDLLS